MSSAVNISFNRRGRRGLRRGSERKLEYATTRSLCVRGHRASVPVQKPIKPVKLPIQTFDQMPWLAGSRQIVIFAWKKTDFRRHAKMFQGAKPLLALFNRNAIVVV